MERKIEIEVGEYYHIYNRGVEKRNIFLDKSDVGEKKVAIIAYVLMPNHFHLLVKEITAGGTSDFMEKLLTGYAMYFNKKYERVGPLFQGTFKAEHADRDE